MSLEDRNFINTEIEPGDCYQSALAIYKDNLYKSIVATDKRYGTKGNKFYDVKHTFLELMLNNDPAIFMGDESIVENAFQYEQKKICKYLEDKEFGLQSAIYIHPKTEQKAFMSQYAKRSISADVHKIISDAYDNSILVEEGESIAANSSVILKNVLLKLNK